MELSIPNRKFPRAANLGETQLQLVFELRQDRYCHQIQGVPGGDASVPASQIWLQSIDDAAAIAWPSSPPLQQIHEQSIQGMPVIMAVGMAGGGHWSASFAAPQGEQAGLLVELAARVVVSGETSLTLRYRIGPQVLVDQTDEATLILQHRDTKLAFELLLHGCQARLHAESSELELIAKLPEKEGLSTVSWGYFLYSVPNSV